MLHFNDLRERYKEFIYRKYEIADLEDTIKLKFYFEIIGLSKFEPEIEISKKKFNFKRIDSNLARNIVFNIGMVEVASYWKCACPQKIIVECGYLDEEQINWYKKLYYYGLGEYRFRNNIEVTYNDFVEIKTTGLKIEEEPASMHGEFKGFLIPIGGGKDSAVTLNLIDNKQDNLCITVGGKEPSIKTAEIAGYRTEKIVEVKRTIAPELIELNKQGFLNGHTPFSALLAFLTYYVAYLINKRYIVLSNESSANESNVNGDKINHQYSKTFEFENDFRRYVAQYLKAEIEYFSILRPINELEIAKLFSKQKQYHNIFKSCNVGSKNTPWRWCCNCPKCLFVFIILSPFLYRDELIKIFEEDLFEKKSLKQTFFELCGYGENKPFECVGTYEEVNFAICKTIQNLGNSELPTLLQLYKANYGIKTFNSDLTQYYNEQNNVPDELAKKIKEGIFND